MRIKTAKFKHAMNLNPVEALLIGAVLFLSVTGLFSTHEYNALPANAIFESVIALSALYIILNAGLTKHSVYILIASAIYIVLSLIYASNFSNAHILDFIQAYKFVYYLMLFSIFANRGFIREKAIKIILYITIVSFAIKYTYSVSLDFTPRMGSRPGLFTENNFELIFLIGLFLLNYKTQSLVSKIITASMIVYIIIISGSRSAAIAFAVSFIIINYRSDLKFMAIYCISIILSLILVMNVFSMRGGFDLESIDRFNFANIFISELNLSGWHNVILGLPRITELSPGSCYSLRYYSGLYSYNGDGSCYSVILHSFNLRVIMDHGIMIFLSFIAAIVAMLLKSGASRLLSFALVMLIFVSGFSVSSFNSVYAATLLMVALGLRR